MKRGALNIEIIMTVFYYFNSLNVPTYLHKWPDNVPRSIYGLAIVNANYTGNPSDNVSRYMSSCIRHCNIFDCDIDILGRCTDLNKFACCCSQTMVARKE